MSSSSGTKDTYDKDLELQSVRLTGSSLNNIDKLAPGESIKEKEYAQNLEKENLIDNEHAKRNYGKHKPFFFCFSQDPFFTIGPDWRYFLCLYTCLLLVSGLLAFYIAPKEGIVLRIITFVAIGWEAFIYLFTALKNPGIASNPNPDTQNDLEIKEDNRFCPHCQILKDDETYHCYDCDVCIEGYDHHCPWTGKCIGKKNIALFNIFLLSTAGYFCYMIGIAIHAGAYSREKD